MNDINEMPPKCQYCPYWEVCEYPWVCPDREQIEDILSNLPSAQSKTVQNISDGDLIDRQAAIDVLHEYFDGMLDTDTVCPADIYGLFECIPSAQPEPLTGKEKMIFLAAMAKEENICKQIDDEYRDCELYEDSLVRACQEIERKVRGALWT